MLSPLRDGHLRRWILTRIDGEATKEGMGKLNGRLSLQSQVQFLGEELIHRSCFTVEREDKCSMVQRVFVALWCGLFS